MGYLHVILRKKLISPVGCCSVLDSLSEVTDYDPVKLLQDWLFLWECRLRNINIILCNCRGNPPLLLIRNKSSGFGKSEKGACNNLNIEEFLGVRQCTHFSREIHVGFHTRIMAANWLDFFMLSNIPAVNGHQQICAQWISNWRSRWKRIKNSMDLIPCKYM